MNVTIRANKLRALLKICLWVYAWTGVFYIAIPWFRGERIDFGNTLPFAAIAGVVMGAFVALAFSPRDMTWNDEMISIKGSWPGSGSHIWPMLEAWSPYGNGVFMLKFEGRQAYQISPAGFRSSEWKLFTSMMKQRFNRKKTLFWLGPRPIRFGK